ncbi:protein translocase subunit SecDF [Mycoplasmopsis hyopharyngis]|uniref:protein translocase subunit SecDF n=1 Tax=Mycoplasmopsis hyopharyngis TaxID=29558 RepID=UPI0038730858
MKNRIKQAFASFFSLTNWKRWLIISITFIATILAIVFGSRFFIAKNINKSVEYGGGLQIIAKMERVNKKDTSPISSKDEENVANALFERLTGGTGLIGTNVIAEGDGRLRITKNGSTFERDKREFERLITTKPSLILTDNQMKPLFLDGKFRNDLSLDQFETKDWFRFASPLKPNGAKLIYSSNKPAVSVDLLDEEAEKEFTKATAYIAEKQNWNDKQLLFWNNLDELKNIAEKNYPKEWQDSGKNFFKFVHVNNNTQPQNDPQNPGKQIPPVLKSNSINARRYLISNVSVWYPLQTRSFVIRSENFTVSDAKQMVANMNYGSSEYTLTTVSSSWTSPELKNNNAFELAMLAGAIVFGLIAIFMIVNYGLLGIISSLSIALYMFLTLMLYTGLGGEYSPSMIAALIIGIGISVDSNIITFERLKDEVYGGDSIKKAYKNANKLSLSSILDANITTLIVSFILFYFGNAQVKSFSITLIFSVMFILISMLLFTKMLTSLLLNMSIFDTKLWLLGIHKKYIDKTKSKTTWYKSFNYVKNSKWFLTASASLIGIGVIVFIVFASINKNIADGFNRSFAFKGGLDVLIKNNEFSGILEKSKVDEIVKYVNNHATEWGIDPKNLIIKESIADTTSNNYLLNIKTDKNTFDPTIMISQLKNNFSGLEIIHHTISNNDAKKLIINAVIAISISFLGILIYTLVRFKWTYSLAILIGLLHIAVASIAFIAIIRAELSPIIVAAVLSIVAFSINDSVIVFDRIKEILRTKWHDEILDRNQIREIANQAIGDVIKRSFYTTLTTVGSIIVLLAFGNATDIWFNLVMIFGLLIGSYTSLFISVWIWTGLETRRQKIILNHQKNHYWNFEKHDEQVFNGINDFVA